MDSRVLYYDADGDIILIDITSELLGVYSADRILCRFWNRQLARIPPGIHYLSFYSDQLEIWNQEKDGSWFIPLDENEAAFFRYHGGQNIPVVAYE